MLMNELIGDLHQCILGLFSPSMVSLVQNKLSDSHWAVKWKALNMLQLAATRSEVLVLQQQYQC